MAPYYPITVVRSDGVTEVRGKTGQLEANSPTAAQQDATQDAEGNVACFRLCPPDHPKVIDWCRKLGGMLIERVFKGELKDSGNKVYILKELPEGYELWAHVKYNVKKVGDGGEGESYDRQDAYLYGHPEGRGKRFRSPADFFPHILWLCTDTEDDPRNCSCTSCNPDDKKTKREREPVENNTKDLDINPKKELKTPQVILPPAKNLQLQASTPAPATSKPSTPNPRTTQPPPSTLANVAAPKPAPAPVPANNRPVRLHEQQADGDANSKYIYRPGELVWFNNGANWRLGIIGKRRIMNERPQFYIQPLSNPSQHQQYLIKDQDTLRPWLAWSVPETTISALKDAVFDQVPWDRVVRGEFDQGCPRDYIVDGSILAAKVIDASYSLFDRNEAALAGPGEVHYKGMFMGAEKIWVGEPVRLRVPAPPAPGSSDIVVLVIHKLIEHPEASRVTFVGDVYRFVEMPTPYSNRSQWPTPDLPPRMVADLRFRNEVADHAHTGMWYEWRLLEPAARKSLADIKGRWYETSKLLPLLLQSPQAFQAQIASGRLTDAGSCMNGRRDNNQVPEQRRKNRRDTIGRAVPENFKVSRGLDADDASDNSFPDELQQPMFDGGMDQYMDLDQAGNYYGH